MFTSIDGELQREDGYAPLGGAKGKKNAAGRGEVSDATRWRFVGNICAAVRQVRSSAEFFAAAAAGCWRKVRLAAGLAGVASVWTELNVVDGHGRLSAFAGDAL